MQDPRQWRGESAARGLVLRRAAAERAAPPAVHHRLQARQQLSTAANRACCGSKQGDERARKHQRNEDGKQPEPAPGDGEPNPCTEDGNAGNAPDEPARAIGARTGDAGAAIGVLMMVRL